VVCRHEFHGTGNWMGAIGTACQVGTEMAKKK